MADLSDSLVAAIDRNVAPLGFQRIHPAPGSLPWIAAWKRKTWNTNRGIAVLRLPEAAPHAGEYALDIRKNAGKAIGYIPFLYELGLQLVLVAPGILRKADGLDRYVTKVNNSTVLLQGIHVVDPDDGSARTVRTWGQVVTGKFIDAVEAAIAACAQDGAGHHA